jgi:hypothetical protein
LDGVFEEGFLEAFFTFLTDFFVVFALALMIGASPCNASANSATDWA